MRHLFVLVLLSVLACGGAPESPPVDEPLEIDTGTATFGQSEIYYEVAGSGEPTVILLHGGMLDRTMWDGQFELLAKTHRVVRYDADAHGKSPLPPDVYWDHASLRELMNALGIDRAILVGLSMGGKVAIDLALENPERVEAIVAVSSGLSGYRFESDFYLEYKDVMIRPGGRGSSMRWWRRSSGPGPTVRIARPETSIPRFGRRCG